MKFSIITPSLSRESLKRCCESVDSQSYDSWEHLIAFDGIPNYPLNYGDVKRRFLSFRETRKWGNYQRRAAWKYATGEYIWHVDDDNRIAHPDALKEMAQHLELAGNPAWALFPISRHGSIFLMEPPGMCRTDTMNMVIKREFAQWPETEAREADGMLADQLIASHPYVAFPDCTAIGIMEHSSNGI